ncbi:MULTISPECIES: type IV pilus modification PilV family protein [Snodgrassella]|uniref:type IV pilus modification PilV family protein n=1 Tax=Snodgrassella TaxID=1193515 RepID=UPI00099630E0|nr:MULTISPECIES: hypothetical protein [Snodgrassella]MBI0132924.1 hypothetical protein [Snodgrassella sp. W8132]OOX78111.1 hypothetical protein BGH94_09960 [Snodgrassella alvi]ORF00263.1 hypothetical protein BGH95_09385 [Snodgrassella alvi]PIT32815.1 hypothetical protein BHC42_08570 [Snodgrassella alvi]PIT33209.1 hypothetical protein BHC50_05515 [Snodgrassella alvi]
MDKYMYRYISVRILYSPNRFQRQNGSTIIEAIVAMFVLSFGVLALMLAQITAVHTSVNAANQGEVTRAVQNYIELMNSQPKISLEVTEDKQKNKIYTLKKDFSDFNNKNCSARLNINLTNAKVKSCVIKDGQITVTWWGQILNKNDDNNDDNNLKDKNLFSYSLTAGQ